MHQSIKYNCTHTLCYLICHRNSYNCTTYTIPGFCVLQTEFHHKCVVWLSPLPNLECLTRLLESTCIEGVRNVYPPASYVYSKLYVLALGPWLYYSCTGRTYKRLLRRGVYSCLRAIGYLRHCDECLTLTCSKALRQILASGRTRGGSAPNYPGPLSNHCLPGKLGKLEYQLLRP